MSEHQKKKNYIVEFDSLYRRMLGKEHNSLSTSKYK